jgi:hypothetical protein
MIRVRIALLLLSLVGSALPAMAQRQLHWDRLDVEATLEADGTLSIVETQTMVFTGDWNGGERIFNIRPRQTLRFHGILREQGGTWRQLTQDSSLDSVDDYALTDANRVRWRSRLPGAPPFAGTVIRYQLHYALSGILLKNETGYTLDHDFIFPDRDGEIRVFELRLTLDPAWEPQSEVRTVYRADGIEPGRSFVLTIPLRFAGEGEPAALDTRRAPAIVRATQVLIGLAVAAAFWLFGREFLRGRFASLPTVENEAWLRQHILAHPAEVVGAAWDDGIGSAEVVALLARLETEGKIESEVRSRSTMALRLTVDRESLDGYERQLIDKLFFNGRVTTDTSLVKRHYREKGFNPVEEIRSGLSAKLDALLPTAQTFLPGTLAGVLLLLSCALLAREWMGGRADTGPAAAVGFGGLFLMMVSGGLGHSFRGALHRGVAAALLTLIPAAAAVGVSYWFLWFYSTTGSIDVSPAFATAVTAMALAVVVVNVASMRSRQRAEGVAFRKRLSAARAFFERELGSDQPALRDEWFPWLLAFGLGPKMDSWSVQHASSNAYSAGTSTTSSSSWSSAESSGGSSSGWTGFAGGRSGGAGASASWAAAAGGMAAGVSPPSSSGSSGGSSSGGSSSGGSSGGGGGGGW